MTYGKPFKDAQYDCISKGSNLVSLNDQAEYEFILKFKQSNNIWVKLNKDIYIFCLLNLNI